MKKLLLFLFLFQTAVGINAQPDKTFTDQNGLFNLSGKNISQGDGTYLSNFLIAPNDRGIVKLTFADIGCNSNEKVYVYDGPDDGATLLGVYDFYNYPREPNDTIFSTSFYISIYLVTDDPKGGEGWSLEYFGAKPVPTVYTATSGSFTDGLIPILSYNNFELHTYQIKPKGATKVELSFPSLYLDNSLPCLWVYDGENENAPLIGEYYALSGCPSCIKNLLPSTIQSTGNSLFIKYLVDGTNDAYWTAQYYGITESVAFLYDASGNRTNRNFISLKSAKADPAELSKQPNTKQPVKKPYQDKSGNADITIYPNPTSGELKVEIANFDFTQQSAIYVFNPLGKLILQKSPASASDVIDLSSYANGLYVMKIMLGDKASEWKILKE